MQGSCLCGHVKFEVHPPFKLFQYCHCRRCQKITGSAHAANLFVDAGQFRWLQGEQDVGRFEVPQAKYFATGFCRCCGSALPWRAKVGSNMVIPAGSLDEDPQIRPRQNVFCASKAVWYTDPAALPLHDELPARRG